MKSISLLFLSILLFFQSFGQDDQKEDKEKKSYKHLPAIGIGGGVLSFHGDVGSNSPVAATSSFRIAYASSIEQRFGSLLGVELKANYGNISKNEHNTTRNLNFESSLMGGELNLNFYFDNIFSKEQLSFSPYIGGGAGFYMFDPHADLLAANGEMYHYWDDGTIRNMTQSNENSLIADTLSRDYVYETKLDSAGFERSTLVFPFQFGLRFKMTQNLSANVSAAYYITQTDFLDNKEEGGDTDGFLNGRVTFVYHIGGYDNNKNPLYDNVDFASIDKEDADADGVRDDKDKCPGTEEGVSVDGKGCALDSDKDGVPDHKDEEKETKKGAIVDENGKTLSEEAQVKLSIDSLATDRDKIKEDYPSLYGILVENNDYPDKLSLGEDFTKGKAKKGKSENGIPYELASADANGDGEITTTEIYGVVDGFFEGVNDFTIEKIHRLIEFFFEQ